jgi:hypothetical protein
MFEIIRDNQVQIDCTVTQVVSASFTSRRPGFAPKAIHEGFVTDKVTLGQVSHRFLWL